MYKFLDFKIYAHEFYRLKSDTFESDRGGVGTCIGTTGINGDHPAQTESVVTVPRLDFQVPWSQQCCLNSGLHATQFSGWLVGRLLCTWHLSKTAEHFVFFFFFLNVYPDITYSQSFLSLCGYFCFLWGLISFTHPINTGIPHIPSIPLNECSQFPLVATTTNAQIIHTYLQVRALLLWALDCINS